MKECFLWEIPACVKLLLSPFFRNNQKKKKKKKKEVIVLDVLSNFFDVFYF